MWTSPNNMENTELNNHQQLRFSNRRLCAVLSFPGIQNKEVISSCYILLYVCTIGALFPLVRHIKTMEEKWAANRVKWQFGVSCST